MKQKTFFVLSLAVSALWLGNCHHQPVEPAAAQTAGGAITNTDPVKRGEYLVGIIGCDDCHTPKNFGPNGPVPDPKRRFMGHPADEPFDSNEDVKNVISASNGALFSSGFTAIAGPWGISYAANLTPDDTGIGNWTEEQFVKAIREGKSKGLDGTRPLLPPMPWPAYRTMTDEDLRAVFAYLKSVPAINNVVPNPKTF
jgi:mono/diheme cytochrome c family protein